MKSHVSWRLLDNVFIFLSLTADAYLWRSGKIWISLLATDKFSSNLIPTNFIGKTSTLIIWMNLHDLLVNLWKHSSKTSWNFQAPIQTFEMQSSVLHAQRGYHNYQFSRSCMGSCKSHPKFYLTVSMPSWMTFSNEVCGCKHFFRAPKIFSAVAWFKKVEVMNCVFTRLSSFIYRMWRSIWPGWDTLFNDSTGRQKIHKSWTVIFAFSLK